MKILTKRVYLIPVTGKAKPFGYFSNSFSTVLSTAKSKFLLIHYLNNMRLVVLIVNCEFKLFRNVNR